MSAKPWLGPVFLFGMARSGTKLLRSVVGGLPDAGFPPREADCVLKVLVRHDGAPADAVRGPLRRSPYFVRRGGKPDLGWLDGESDAASRFERFCRHEGDVPGGLWGDKSPAYIRCLPALAARWPDARFVHILRDPRDVCRSTHRAWGKSHERCAQHWADRVAGALAWSEGRDDVLTIRYEALVETPREVAARVAGFVGREFDEGMLQAESGETVGLVRGERGVVQLDRGSDDSLSPAQLARVEAICRPLMERLGYLPATDSPQAEEVPAWRMAALRATDGVHMLRHRARRVGWVQTLRTSRPS